MPTAFATFSEGKCEGFRRKPTEENSQERISGQELANQSLNTRGFLTNQFGCAQQLSIETDTLEPIVQTQQVSEPHAAMHFG